MARILHASQAAPAAPATGLRERKKRATRTSLLEVAFELFRTQGYERTTLPQIAARAAVAPRTVGNYFPQKVDLLVSYRETMLAAAEQAASRSAGRPPLERLRETVLAAARENERHPDGRLAQALIAEHASYRALAAVEDRFTALLLHVGEFGLRPGTDAELAVLALVAGYVALQRRWARGDRPSLVADVSRLLDQWTAGVGA